MDDNGIVPPFIHLRWFNNIPANLRNWKMEEHLLCIRWCGPR